MTSDIKLKVLEPDTKSVINASHISKMRASGYTESEIDRVTDFFNKKIYIKKRMREVVKCRCGKLEDICYVCRMEKMRDEQK